MKVGLLVIAFNVDQWIYQMLKNTKGNVDIVYIAYPRKPWNYRKGLRSSIKNPTILDVSVIDSIGIDYEIITGDWQLDEDTRNDILEIAKADKCDWLVVQDADEFYSEDGWSDLKRIMMANYGKDLAITTKWLNFWKNTEYVVMNNDGSVLSDNESAAISLAGNAHFTYSRSVSCPLIHSDIVCYHLGYVMNSDQVRLKIASWAHTLDVRVDEWFEHKWRRWNISTKYLHPGNPPVWRKAIKRDSSILIPEECKSYSDLNNRLDPTVSKQNLSTRLNELIYDLRSIVVYRWKRFKAFIRGISK